VTGYKLKTKKHAQQRHPADKEIIMKTLNLSSLFLIPVILILIYSCNSKPKWEDYRGGTHIILGVESKGDTKMDSKNVKIIADILKFRLNDLGIKTKIVKIRENNQIIIQTPPVKNAEMLAKVLSYSTVLEFRLIDENIKASEFKTNNNQAKREILYQIETDSRTGIQSKIPYVTETENFFPMGEYLKYVKDDTAKDENGVSTSYVTIDLTDQGAKLFEEFTANHTKRRLAVVLNDRIYSAPRIKEKISGGRIQIDGIGSKAEAHDLAIVLKAGCYPTHTSLIEVKELTKDYWLGSIE